MRKVLNSQFFKFAVTGILNTTVDFVIAKTLLFFVEETLLWFMVAKTFAFIGATTNSFIMNRSWTFKSSKSYSSEILSFIAISCVGLLVNVSSASLLFYLLFGYFSPETTETLSLLGAALFSFLFNYFGYKYLVFKKNV